MAQQFAEIDAIANNPAPPTFENTFVAMERSGRLLARASAAFNGVSQANTNPVLQQAKTALAPQLAAHQDAIRLHGKLQEAGVISYRRGHIKVLDRAKLGRAQVETVIAALEPGLHVYVGKEKTQVVVREIWTAIDALGGDS